MTTIASGGVIETQMPDHVGVATPNLVYVLIRDRSKFDKIAVPWTDHGQKASGHCLSKRVGNLGTNEVSVIFQHWVKSP